MKSGEASRVRRAPCLLLLAVLWLLSACSLAAPDAQEDPFTGPPVIRIAAPLPEQRYLSGATVIVQARIENAGPDLALVRMLLDGAVLGEKQNPNPIGAAVVPVTIDWPTSNPGRYEITVAAERGDGSGASESVAIAVLPPATAEDNQTESLGAEADTTRRDTAEAPPPEASAQDDASVLSSTVLSSTELSATAIPATSPPSLPGSSVAAVIAKPSNLRRGPGTSFDLIGSIGVNQEVIIVGLNPDRDWYHIRYGDQGDAWIYSELLSPSSDLAALPVEAGPAPAAPASTELATVAPLAEGVNLVIAELRLEPENLVCNQTGRVTVSIRNEGAQDTGAGGWIVVQDTVPGREAAVVESEPANPFPAIRAGETITAMPVNITVSAFTDETHRIVVAVDSGGHIAETNEDDNSQFLAYTLQRGDCP